MESEQALLQAAFRGSRQRGPSVFDDKTRRLRWAKAKSPKKTDDELLIEGIQSGKLLSGGDGGDGGGAGVEATAPATPSKDAKAGGRKGKHKLVPASPAPAAPEADAAGDDVAAIEGELAAERKALAEKEAEARRLRDRVTTLQARQRAIAVDRWPQAGILCLCMTAIVCISLCVSDYAIG